MNYLKIKIFVLTFLLGLGVMCGQPKVGDIYYKGEPIGGTVFYVDDIFKTAYVVGDPLNVKHQWGPKNVITGTRGELGTGKSNTELIVLRLDFLTSLRRRLIVLTNSLTEYHNANIVFRQEERRLNKEDNMIMINKMNEVFTYAKMCWDDYKKIGPGALRDEIDLSYVFQLVNPNMSIPLLNLNNLNDIEYTYKALKQLRDVDDLLQDKLTTDCAAKECSDLKTRFGESERHFDDWYLPSIMELNQVVKLPIVSLALKYDDQHIWTSTQESDKKANSMNSQKCYISYMDDSYLVYPVRQFYYKDEEPGFNVESILNVQYQPQIGDKMKEGVVCKVNNKRRLMYVAEKKDHADGENIWDNANQYAESQGKALPSKEVMDNLISLSHEDLRLGEGEFEPLNGAYWTSHKHGDSLAEQYSTTDGYVIEHRDSLAKVRHVSLFAYDIEGCTNIFACNYDSTATVDNGLCKIKDLDGNCVLESLLGNGSCDDGGLEAKANFMSEMFNYDGGDCGDCNGQDFPLERLGDSVCDDTLSSLINLNCEIYSYDEGDCVSDCSGNNYIMPTIAEIYNADGECDDGTLRYNFKCEAFNYDGGDCLVDCDGQDYSGYEYWIGDGECDDGKKYLPPLNFKCEAFYYDAGDCLVDCDGENYSGYERYIGDGECHDGTLGYNFKCEAFYYDGGDCRESRLASTPSSNEKKYINKRESSIDIELFTLLDPNTNILTLNVIGKHDYGQLIWHLYDLKGILLNSNKVKGSKTAISMEDFPDAVYIFKVSIEKEEIKTFKIMKN